MVIDCKIEMCSRRAVHVIAYIMNGDDTIYVEYYCEKHSNEFKERFRHEHNMTVQKIPTATKWYSPMDGGLCEV